MKQQHADAWSGSDRLAGWVAFGAFPIALGLGALQAFHYRVPLAGALVAGIAVLLALSPWVGRLGISAVHWVSALIVMGVGLTSYLRGGLILPVMTFAFVSPLGAFLLRRPRAAIGWTLAGVALGAALDVLERLGLAPPRVESSWFGASVGVIGGLLFTLVLLALQDRQRRDALLRHAEMERALMAARHLEGIARLAGGVAHDFNNLLAIILSHARVVSEGLAPDDERVADLRAIESAAQAGVDLTRRLLAVAREDSEESEASPVALHDTVVEIGRLLEKTLPDNVTLVCEADGALTVVEADPRQVQQVVMNLVINSRDAMPSGGRITLRTAHEVLDRARSTPFGEIPAGRYVSLEVEDQGEGMTEEVLARVFEPFFTTKGRERGTGLGLPLVHGVVTALGGHLDIRSAPGSGTVVRVLLPPSDRAPIATEQRHSIAPTVTPAALLLVEDDAGVRRATERLLRLDGHEVLLASSGAEALELLREGALVDVLITDVVMPGMSGRDLARTVRQERPELGVVYMSGYAGDHLTAEDLAQPRVAFLQKPASRGAIARAIASVRG